MKCGCCGGPRLSARWKFTDAAVLVFLSLFFARYAIASDRAAAFDMSPTEVTILNPDTREVLGHGHYKVTLDERGESFEGENRFVNGEYDHEVQRVERSSAGAPPRLISYQHSFFNADGSPESIDALDARTGVLACTHYDSSGTADVRQMKAELPPDTYVGSTQLMLLVGRLREGVHDLSMHTFICFPGPRIVALKATPSATAEKWAMYPGNLVRVEMVPDLGWVSTIASPFIPKASGWFDPTEDFNYVGGLFDRFYRHRHLMMVRTPAPPGGVQNSSLPH